VQGTENLRITYNLSICDAKRSLFELETTDYYQYSQPMMKDILFYIITALHKIYYTVVAVTNDLGPTNIALWNELNIGVGLSKSQQGISKDFSEKKYFFEHPADKSLKIFVFADVPHLIKLLRNNFIDYGFLVGEKILNKRILEERCTEFQRFKNCFQFK